MLGASGDIRRLRDVAETYRRLVLLVGAQILLAMLRSSLAAGAETPAARAAIAAIVLLAWLGLAVALAVNGFRLAGFLRLGVPILWAIGMFLPLLNIVVLLTLSNKAQGICRQHGVSVGLLGPKMSDVERLEQSSR